MAETVGSTEATGSAERGRRKVRIGVVVSDAMDKTVVVRISSQMRHPLYGKTVRRSTKLKAHDEVNDAHVGDTVRIVETRPMSKSKRWRLVDVIERAK
jgi:small subunit ribosomal protein S17